jgi:hypothetical protein
VTLEVTVQWLVRLIRIQHVSCLIFGPEISNPEVVLIFLQSWILISNLEMAASFKSRDSSVGIVMATGWTTGVQIPAGIIFSLRHRAKPGFEAHQASY